MDEGVYGAFASSARSSALPTPPMSSSATITGRPLPRPVTGWRVSPPEPRNGVPPGVPGCVGNPVGKTGVIVGVGTAVAGGVSDGPPALGVTAGLDDDAGGEEGGRDVGGCVVWVGVGDFVAPRTITLPRMPADSWVRQT